MRATIFVIGEVKGQPRARVGRFAKDVTRLYTPTTANGWRYPLTLAMGELAQQFGHPIAKACRIDVTFYFERPRTHWRKKKEFRVLSTTAPIYHENKPDRDNCDKLVLDCATAASLVSDDCKVVVGTIEKRYATHEPPGALITIDDDLGPTKVGELYGEDLLDLEKHPRRVPPHAKTFSSNAFSTPSIIPTVTEEQDPSIKCG